MAGQEHPEEGPETRNARRLAAALERYDSGRGVDPERFLEIRMRIAGGFYDRPGVRLAAARALLESGDVKARGLLPE